MGHKKHHYIPQCYLKGFSHEISNKIFHVNIYDRITRSTAFPNINDIFAENYLYKVDQPGLQYIKKQSNDKANIFEEEFFANFIEPIYKEKLVFLVDSINHDTIFPLYEKFNFSLLMAIQLLRLPLQKYYFSRKFNLFIKFCEDNISIEKSSIDISKLSGLDEAIIHYLNGYGNYRLVETIARFFYFGKWSFYKDVKGRFLTSDSPIVLKPTICELYSNYFAVSKDIACISFPITKNILLDIEVLTSTSVDEYKKCYIYNATDTQVANFNCLRFLYCNRQVAGYYDDFSQIEKIMNIIRVNFISDKDILNNGKINNA